MSVERWERRSEVPLILLALAFLVAYAWPVINPRLGADLRGSLTLLSWAVWGAFAADLLIRLVLAEDRRRYTARHWYDVALVALPLRPRQGQPRVADTKLSNAAPESPTDLARGRFPRVRVDREPQPPDRPL